MQTRENADRIRKLTDDENRQIAMIHAQGEQIQKTMNRNHEAFMAQQESQFQSEMKGAGDAMNARSTAASDWVDYSLDPDREWVWRLG
jgi:capsule polysaccharide export protein KpsE/RkpR